MKKDLFKDLRKNHEFTRFISKKKELRRVAKDLELANSGLSEYQEAAEENYQQVLHEVNKWQEKFEIAFKLQYLYLAYEALLVRNAYKEEGRKLEAVIDKQLAQSIKNLATLEDINKLLENLSNLLE